jgi:hypothetical protein
MSMITKLLKVSLTSNPPIEENWIATEVPSFELPFMMHSVVGRTLVWVKWESERSPICLWLLQPK